MSAVLFVPEQDVHGLLSAILQSFCIFTGGCGLVPQCRVIVAIRVSESLAREYVINDIIASAIDFRRDWWQISDVFVTRHGDWVVAIRTTSPIHNI